MTQLPLPDRLDHIYEVQRLERPQSGCSFTPSSLETFYSVFSGPTLA